MGWGHVGSLLRGGSEIFVGGGQVRFFGGSELCWWAGEIFKTGHMGSLLGAGEMYVGRGKWDLYCMKALKSLLGGEKQMRSMFRRGKWNFFVGR